MSNNVVQYASGALLKPRFRNPRNNNVKTDSYKDAHYYFIYVIKLIASHKIKIRNQLVYNF